MASSDSDAWLDVSATPYSNGAHTASNAVFLSLISLSLVAGVAIAWRTRRFVPFTFQLATACVLEMLAYVLRLQAWSFGTYAASYVLATIAPVFLTIAIHLALAQVIPLLGAAHAPLLSAAYLRTFVWTDIASLCVQAVGLCLTFAGARAAGPERLLLPAHAQTGQAILFAGLLLHTISLAAALAVLAVTCFRSRAAGVGPHRATAHGYHAPMRRRGVPPAPASPCFKLFLATLLLAGASVLVRCAYRTAAAWGGLGSPIAKDGLLWLVAEGALLTEAMVSLAVCHPALCMGDISSSTAAAASSRTQDLEAGRPAMTMGGKRYSSGSNTLLSTAPNGESRRYSSATTLSVADVSSPSPERMATHESPRLSLPQSHRRHRSHPSDEGGRLLYGSHGANYLMAPSEAGSSDAAHGSRRGSVAVLLDADPYYQYEDPFAPFASPLAEEDDDDDDNNRNNSGNPYNRRFSEDITSEAQGNSLRTADDDAAETESFVLPPRKSSKRVSRVFSPSGADIMAVAEAQDRPAAREDGDDAGDSEPESFVLPPRKSSKRMSRVLEEAGQDREWSILSPPRKSSKRQSVPAGPPPVRRGLSMRSDEDDDGFDAASFVLPSRKPSRTSTRHGHGREDLDAVSLYSQ